MHRIEAPKTVAITVAATSVTTQAPKANRYMYRMEMKSKDHNNLEKSELKHPTNDDQRL